MDLLGKLAILQQQQTIMFLMFVYVMVRFASRSGEGKRPATLFDKVLLGGLAIFWIADFVRAR